MNSECYNWEVSPRKYVFAVFTVYNLRSWNHSWAPGNASWMIKNTGIPVQTAEMGIGIACSRNHRVSVAGVCEMTKRKNAV